MAAQAADRDAKRLGALYPDSPGALGVKAATRIYGGSLIVNDAGVAAPGRTATGLIPLGVARKQADNTSGAANAISVEYDIGDFYFANLGGDPVLAVDIGNDAWIVDDQTVAKTNGTSTRSRAGKIVALDATYGVCVRVGVGF